MIISHKSKKSVTGKKQKEQGIALVTVLVLLLLLTGLSIAMALTLNSDLLMGGYYANSRACFYAADSGLALVRQEMANQLLGIADAANVSTGASPLNTTKTGTALDTVRNEFGTSSSFLGMTSINSSGSRGEKFYIDKNNTSLELTSCTVYIKNQPPSPNCTLPQTAATQWQYKFAYKITTVGKSSGYESTAVTENGTFTVTVPMKPADDLSHYGTFINDSPLCDAPLVGGTYTGTQFTNGSWGFSANYTYTFLGKVQSHGQKAGYWPKTGSCTGYDANAGNGSAPNFKQGFDRGVDSVPLPQTSASQERAVLDGIGTIVKDSDGKEIPPTAAEKAAVLKNASQNSFDVSKNTKTQYGGVYMSYSKVGGTPTMTGGGILVQGPADSIVITPTGTSPALTQTYTIKQGPVTTTIIVDNYHNTTTLKDSTGASVLITGVPQDKSSGTAVNGTCLYVDGVITSLAGPGTDKPAIQDGTNLTVASSGDITITNDLTYVTTPVYLSATDAAKAGKEVSDPIDGTAEKAGVFGIYTADGAVILNPASDSYTGSGKSKVVNLYVDASIVTSSEASTGKTCNMNVGVCPGSISYKLDNVDSINEFRILGGRVQNKAQTMNSGTIGTRNIYFDGRFENGYAPPFFPKQPVPEKYKSNASFARTQWFSKMSN